MSKRCVLMQKDGFVRILGLADPDGQTQCKDGSLLSFNGIYASLIRVTSRSYIYREISVPEKLLAFNDGQK
jgi:hypothetical protein